MYLKCAKADILVKKTERRMSGCVRTKCLPQILFELISAPTTTTNTTGKGKYNVLSN